MNKEILRSYWKKPHSIASNHLDELKKLCDEYPYAVALKQLYCKALIVHHDLSFEKILKPTSVQTAHRSVLRSWLLGDVNVQSKYLYASLNEPVEEEEDFANHALPNTEVQEDFQKKEELGDPKQISAQLDDTTEDSVSQTSELIPDDRVSNLKMADEVSESPKELVDEKAKEESVDWDAIGPVKITLLPVQGQFETEDLKEDKSLDNLKVENDLKIVVAEYEGVNDVNTVKDLPESINVQNQQEIQELTIESRKNEIELSKKEDVDKELDQQILQAAIVASEYKIPELENKKVDSKAKKASFVDWIDRVEKGELNDEEFAFRKKAEKIIDQFLATQPKIKIKREFFTADNYVKKGTEENEDIVSETLIKIYIKQGHIQKAIDGYKILQKKIPDKHDFFQEQINNLL